MSNETSAFFAGVVIMAMLLTYPVMFLMEFSYAQGQKAAILGNVKYEMTIIPAVTPSPDTVWIRKGK